MMINSWVIIYHAISWPTFTLVRSIVLSTDKLLWHKKMTFHDMWTWRQFHWPDFELYVKVPWLSGHLKPCDCSMEAATRISRCTPEWFQETDFFLQSTKFSWKFPWFLRIRNSWASEALQPHHPILGGSISEITFEGSAELQIQLQSLDLCSEKGHMCHGTPQRTPAVVCS